MSTLRHFEDIDDDAIHDEVVLRCEEDGFVDLVGRFRDEGDRLAIDRAVGLHRRKSVDDDEHAVAVAILLRLRIDEDEIPVLDKLPVHLRPIHGGA